jgi:hypothetical protein
MRCETCGADVLPTGQVVTSHARKTGNTALWLSGAAANARFCQYARQREKPCANPCGPLMSLKHLRRVPKPSTLH